MNQISSDSPIPINCHFKIESGPGAGKTYWLTNHIKHILSESEILTPSRKIACITYTNTGAQTIKNRIPYSLDHVEVSTFHSFLYRFIVRPYIHFIANTYDINTSKIEGHEDPFPKKSITEAWLAHPDVCGQLKSPYSFKQLTALPNNSEKLRHWLLSIKYEVNNSSEVKITANDAAAFSKEEGKRSYLSKKCLNILRPHLMKYKTKFFSEGILFHDDILFLALEILKRNPELTKIISIKFPYILVDEFQDTHPIQSQVLKKLGESGSIIGLIGDTAQSIYEFNGATPNSFSNFTLPGMDNFLIKENRRSTPEIISILDKIRPEFSQTPVKSSGKMPVLFIGGSLEGAINIARKQNPEIKILSRKNIQANSIRLGVKPEPEIDIITLWNEIDNDKIRKKIITKLIASIESARGLDFKNSIKHLKKLTQYKISSSDSASDENILLLAISNCNSSTNGSLSQLLEFALRFYKFSQPRKKETVNFYEKLKYHQLAAVLDIENFDYSITIHKAKGDEFDAVFLNLANSSSLDFITNPKLTEEEEHRIYYVAISRAKENLYIWIPKLEKDQINKVSNLFLVQNL